MNRMGDGLPHDGPQTDGSARCELPSRRSLEEGWEEVSLTLEGVRC